MALPTSSHDGALPSAVAAPVAAVALSPVAAAALAIAPRARDAVPPRLGSEYQAVDLPPLPERGGGRPRLRLPLVQLHAAGAARVIDRLCAQYGVRQQQYRQVAGTKRSRTGVPIPEPGPAGETAAPTPPPPPVPTHAVAVELNVEVVAAAVHGTDRTAALHVQPLLQAAVVRSVLHLAIMFASDDPCRHPRDLILRWCRAVAKAVARLRGLMPADVTPGTLSDATAGEAATMRHQVPPQPVRILRNITSSFLDSVAYVTTFAVQLLALCCVPEPITPNVDHISDETLLGMMPRTLADVSPATLMSTVELAWRPPEIMALMAGMTRHYKSFAHVAHSVRCELAALLASTDPATAGEADLVRGRDVHLHATSATVVAFYYGLWRRTPEYDAWRKKRVALGRVKRLEKERVRRDRAWFHYWRFDEDVLGPPLPPAAVPLPTVLRPRRGLIEQMEQQQQRTAGLGGARGRSMPAARRWSRSLPSGDDAEVGSASARRGSISGIAVSPRAAEYVLPLVVPTLDVLIAADGRTFEALPRKKPAEQASKGDLAGQHVQTRSAAGVAPAAAAARGGAAVAAARAGAGAGKERTLTAGQSVVPYRFPVGDIATFAVVQSPTQPPPPAPLPMPATLKAMVEVLDDMQHVDPLGDLATVLDAATAALDEAHAAMADPTATAAGTPASAALRRRLLTTLSPAGSHGGTAPATLTHAVTVAQSAAKGMPHIFSDDWVANRFIENESYCALCGDGGELVCCEGPCRRSFHRECLRTSDKGLRATLRASPSLQAIKGVAGLFDLERDDWQCPACTLSTHECFICGQQGHDDVDIFRCMRMCGKYYHIECVGSNPRTVFVPHLPHDAAAPVPPPVSTRASASTAAGSGAAAEVRRMTTAELAAVVNVAVPAAVIAESEAGGVPLAGRLPNCMRGLLPTKFVCPFHLCRACGEPLDPFRPPLYVRCHACPTTYHDSCRPRDVLVDHHDTITCADIAAHGSKRLSSEYKRISGLAAQAAGLGRLGTLIAPPERRPAPLPASAPRSTMTAGSAPAAMWEQMLVRGGSAPVHPASKPAPPRLLPRAPPPAPAVAAVPAPAAQPAPQPAPASISVWAGPARPSPAAGHAASPVAAPAATPVAAVHAPTPTVLPSKQSAPPLSGPLVAARGGGDGARTQPASAGGAAASAPAQAAAAAGAASSSTASVAPPVIPFVAPPSYLRWTGRLLAAPRVPTHPAAIEHPLSYFDVDRSAAQMHTTHFASIDARFREEIVRRAALVRAAGLPKPGKPPLATAAASAGTDGSAGGGDGGGSSYCGVHRTATGFSTRLSIGGKTRQVGVYADEVEAAVAYDYATSFWRGRAPSRLNFPGSASDCTVEPPIDPWPRHIREALNRGELDLPVPRLDSSYDEVVNVLKESFALSRDRYHAARRAGGSGGGGAAR